ncbi:MAG: alanine--tRNA ligase [Dehalococcoidia bacterium]
MTSDQIRELFLKFFEEKGHKIIPSSSLVPHGDPTLLLTSAGMVQIKPYFLGEEKPPSPRLTSCQKCFRTSDIDAVGDASHLTFFEMLGNFSVGDYFKAEAISWAWEFVTQRLRLEPERLWITIFQDDEEAFGHWREIGIPAERIWRFGEEDNFWGPAGQSGPCGPCSEIHYDLGEEYGRGILHGVKDRCGPNCDCGRFLEIWNLVFMQYDQDPQGKRTPLPRPNIDTGMGLERTAAVMQGTTSAYDTDLFRPLIDCVCGLTGKEYGQDEATDRALRVVVEHGRGIVFLIADGVVPGHEGRGYVLRRVLRRAALFGRKLGREEPFLSGVAQVVIKQMGHIYPELVQHRDLVLRVIDMEEKRFHETLSTGLGLLEEIMDEAERGRRKVISGQEVFRLYDTYGFPGELTKEIALERGFEVDMDGFEVEMEAQRERARAAKKFGLEEKATPEAYRQLGIESTDFVGYEKLRHTSPVVGLLVGGQPAERAFEGQEAEVVLLESTFYGEMGGQVGDTGEIRGPEGLFIVTDTMHPWPELIVHHGHLVRGQISLNDDVEAEVDMARRLDIARNHTATHLLQAALRRVLGGHVLQRGSVVSPERLRFDFSHLMAPAPEELAQVQRLVNESIRQNIPVTARVLPYKEAIAGGAIALFGEKYGDMVRMMEIQGVSAELCGGTHLERTGEIGYFLITSESSIGAGLRRIEALTGRGAETFLEGRLSTVEALSRELGGTPDEVQEKVASLAKQLERERKRAQSLERELSKRVVESLLGQAEAVNGVNVLSARVSASNMEVLKEMGDQLKERLRSAVVVLGAIYDNRPNFLAMVTPDLVARGIHAGEIVKKVAQATGGGGGGRAEMAQAGGKDQGKLDEALKLVKDIVRPR